MVSFRPFLTSEGVNDYKARHRNRLAVCRELANARYLFGVHVCYYWVATGGTAKSPNVLQDKHTPFFSKIFLTCVLSAGFISKAMQISQPIINTLRSPSMSFSFIFQFRSNQALNRICLAESARSCYRAKPSFERFLLFAPCANIRDRAFSTPHPKVWLSFSLEGHWKFLLAQTSKQ